MISLNHYVLLPVGLSLLVLAGCLFRGASCPNPLSLNDSMVVAGILNEIPPREYWPTEGWESRTAVTPEGCEVLVDLSTKISADLPYVNSLIVVTGGYVVYEGYFNEYQPEDLQLQQSVAKSITSALVGIALDRDEIAGLDVRVGEVLPELFMDGQSTISPDISLQDALMMRSGLAYDAVNLTGEFESESAYQDYVDTRLSENLSVTVAMVPQAHDPGTVWQYNTSDTQLISEMFQELVGQSLADYAGENLFGPLGITDYIWQHDAEGVTVGGALLWLRPVDMAKFGYLYLNEGVWDDAQIVPAEWVEVSTQPQGEALNPAANEAKPITNYGYLWWLWEPGSFNLPGGAYQALGYGGQMILVFPDIDTVVVATSNALVSGQVSGAQQKELIKFINQHVVSDLAMQVVR